MDALVFRRMSLTAKACLITVMLLVLVSGALSYAAVSAVEDSINREAINRQNSSLRIAAMEFSCTASDHLNR